MDQEVKLPPTYPVWSTPAQRRRKLRRQQFVGDFGLRVFFAMVFAIVIHMVAGR
jgi:hypothetical protein